LVAFRGQTTNLQAFTRDGGIFRQNPLPAKLLIGSNNLGCKNGTDLLYRHAKYNGGDRTPASVDEKCDVFGMSVFCHAFELQS